MPDQVRSRSYPLESLRFSVAETALGEGAAPLNEVEELLGRARVTQQRQLESDRVISIIQSPFFQSGVIAGAISLTWLMVAIYMKCMSYIVSFDTNSEVPGWMFDVQETLEEGSMLIAKISGLACLVLGFMAVLHGRLTRNSLN